MHWLRRTLLLLPGRRQRRARELDEELRTNLALAVEDAGGQPETERQARIAFGSLTRAREEARAVWLPGWDTLRQDLRFALRTLARAPAFTVVAVLSLALGTGAATALFSLVNTVVLKPLAYREPGKLVMAREVLPALAHIYPSLPVNYEHYRFWREQSRAFEALAVVSPQKAPLVSGGEPEAVGGAAVSANLFAMLGVEAQLGRTFRPEEEQPSKSGVMVITDGLWRRRFGASPSVVGETVQLDGGYKQTIIGVLPASFRFPKKDDLGSLSRLTDNTEVFQILQSPDNGWGGDYDYLVLGRLRHGVTRAAANAELNLLEKRIAAEHGLGYALSAQLLPLQEVITSPVKTSLMVLLAAVMLLVLMVCVNLANLLLARASARAREYSLRIALGAGRGRLVVSALVETLLLAGAGGVLGVIVARAALAVFARTAPVDLPRLDEVQVDGRVWAFAFLLSLACGLFFGLLPALRLSRTDPQTALRGASPNVAGSRRGMHLREWLVSAEVALSTLLLVLAGLLTTSLWNVLHVDRGFTDDRALDVHLQLPARYKDAKDRAAFFGMAADGLRALPGVRAAGVVDAIPLTGESEVNDVTLDGADSSAIDNGRQVVMINVRFVGPDYFTALGIPLRHGRTIEAGDRDRSVAVVSERLAAKLWPGQNPLGKGLKTGSRVGRVEVVGVVADVHNAQLDRDPTLIVYVPIWKRVPWTADLVVRSSMAASALPREVRRVLTAIDPGLPAPKMRTMGQLVDETVARRRFQMQVAIGFGVAAMLLAAVGIYGVVAYGIALRRRELGIRMALGARAGQVRRLVLYQGLRPVLLGLAAGVAAALAAGQLVRSLLFGVTASDGLTLAAAAGMLTLVAALACLVPAQAAARIDPARVLRDE
ncbi:MAG: ADOP family duplicated permease [Bryobacteraceae bacterium]|jgi:putative ABC transport system permease protein